MKHKALNLLLVLLFVVPTINNAQNLPIDPSIRYGKLENGLTYFIQRNTNPEGKASFFLPQKVGSIQEDDSQKGLAHFLEHMAFSSTKHFPEKVTDILEKRGVTFGRNINAYTSLDQTVYYLSDVPVDGENKGLIDTCLLILHDWCGHISLKEDDIDKERKVIKEEWRTRDGAMIRIWTKQMKEILAGTKYEDRSPIGDMDVVENFKYDELRNYYRRWYRPDLQGLIVVGDFDVDEVEKKVKDLFSALTMPENPEERIYYPVADNDEPIISIVTDKEATNTSLSVMIKHDIIPFEKRNSNEFLFAYYLTGMASGIMNSRFREIQEKPDAPFSYAFANYGEFSDTYSKDAFTVRAGCKEGMVVEALQILETEKERIRRYGFTESEVERAKTNLLKEYENRYNNRSTQTTAAIINPILHNFLISGPIAGIEYEYNLLKEVFSRMTVEMTVNIFNEWAKAIIKDKNIVVTISGPEKEGLVYPQPGEIKTIIASIKNADIKPYEDEVPEGELISNLPGPGRIVKETKNEKYDFVEWTLSNNMRVTYKKTDFVNDGINMLATGPGGTSLFEDSEILNASMVSSIAGVGGWGNFSSKDMDKKLAGKTARIGSSINPFTQSMSGNTTKADLETFFQLIHLRFTSPRKDLEAFIAMTERLKSSLLNQEANPNKAFSDSIQFALFNNHPRAFSIKSEDIEHLNYDRMLEMYKTCFANPGSFVMNFCGSIDVDSLRIYVEKYLACLPSGNKDIKPVNRNLELRKGKYVNRFIKKGETPKASSFILYNGYTERTETVTYRIQILQNIISDILRRSLRGEEGGTYGARTNYEISRFPYGQTMLQIFYDTNPERIDEMNGIVYREMKKLVEEGPMQEDFETAQQGVLKSYESYQRLNGFWIAIAELVYLYNEDENGSTDYKGQIMTVTKDEIQQLMKGLLDQGNSIEVVMITEP